MEYELFIEDNEWEGEKWLWFVPLSKEDKEAISKSIKGNWSYSFADKTYTEKEIDIMSELNKYINGYCSFVNKMSGHNLDIGNLPSLSDYEDDCDNDPFYKGGCWV